MHNELLEIAGEGDECQLPLFSGTSAADPPGMGIGQSPALPANRFV